MKRLILCGLLGLSLCGSARAAITDSLVGYWKFNETGAATTAADASGFNHPGNVKNFTGTYWVAGVASNALNFDGANDHVLIPNYTKATTTLSVAAWVWADARPTWASIAKNWGDTVAGQFHFGLENSLGLLSILLQQSNGVVIGVSEGTVLPTLSWQHVAFVADGATLRLYRNGAEVASAPYDGTIKVPAAPLTSIGIGVKLNDNGNAPSGDYWDGKIDDVGVWTRGLTAAEVSVIYSAGTLGRALDAATNPGVLTLAASAVGLTDATLNASVSPNGLPVTVFFDWGTTTGYGSTTAAQNIAADTNSVAFNAALTGLAQNTTYHFRARAGNGAGIVYGPDATFTTLAPPSSVTLAPTVGSYAATLQGAVIAGSQPATAFFEWGTTTAYGNSTVGQGFGASFTSNNFTFFLNNLTPLITYHYRAVVVNALGRSDGVDVVFTTPAFEAITNSLVGYWKFNETGAATVAADSSGFNHPGNVKNFTGTYWVAGVASNALNFDGVNDYVLIPNYTKATTTLSVAAWVWADSRPIWGSIAKNWGDAVAGQFHLGFNSSSGLLEIRLQQSNGAVVGINDATVLPTNSWQHVAFVADGATLRLYRNGAQVGSTPYDGTIKVPAAPLNTIGIGVKTADSGVDPSATVPGYWDGKIDEVGVWTRGLSSNQVNTIYTVGLAGRALDTVTNASVLTLAASAVGATNATLNGSVNPGGLPVTVFFEWGINNTAYGNNTATVAQNIPAGTGSVAFNAALPGLAPATTYHFRAVAANGAGRAYGADTIFTVPATPPALGVPQVTQNNLTSVVVTVSVTNREVPVMAHLEYGPGSYASSSTTQAVAALQTPTLSWTLPVQDLESNYVVRLAVNDGFATYHSGSNTFSTYPVPPQAVTLPATSVQAYDAVLPGQVSSPSYTGTVIFVWGPTNAPQSFRRTLGVPAASALAAVATAVSNLVPATNYAFQVGLSNEAYTVWGLVRNFTTLPSGPQQASFSVAILEGGLVQLTGTFVPGSLAGGAYFEWGTNTTTFTQGQRSAATPFASGFAPVTHQLVLSNLEERVLYYARLVPTNNAGLAGDAGTTFNAPTPFRRVPLGIYRAGMGNGVVIADLQATNGPLSVIVSGHSTVPVLNKGGAQVFEFSEQLVHALTFQTRGAPLVPALAFADLSHDGYLTGASTQSPFPSSGSKFALALLPNGNGANHVEEFTSFSVPNVIRLEMNGFQMANPTLDARASLAWGDYDNDGNPDLVASTYGDGIRYGDYTGGKTLLLYHNNGDGTFSPRPLPALVSQDGTINHFGWVDVNRDGRLDLWLTGNHFIVPVGGLNGWFVMIFLINDGDGVFHVEAPLEFRASRSIIDNASWADFDGDGDLDIMDGGGYYRNDSGQFPRGQYFGRTPNGTTTVGDYDNDGRPDALYTGWAFNGQNTTTRLLHNEGNGNFTLDTARWPFLAGDRLDVGASTFGDLNGDGRLDVACTSTNLADPLSVFVSTTARTNTPPLPPTNLVATLANNSAHFRWNAGSDAATPALSLSYNLRVGTHPGGREVVSPMAGDDGRLRMAVLGNVQIGTNAFVTNLPPGNYFWSVQSVDMGWSGSVFSQDGQFTIATGPATRPATGVDATTVQFQGTVVPGAEAATVWFEWCLDGPLTNRTAEQVIPAGPTPVAVAQTLVLDTDALHSFRLVSSNSAGVVAGHTLGVLRTDTTQLSFPSPPNFHPTFLNYRARRNTLVHAEYSEDLVQWKRVTGFRAGASARYYPQFNTNQFYRLVAP